jgi:hypothetical protein
MGEWDSTRNFLVAGLFCRGYQVDRVCSFTTEYDEHDHDERPARDGVRGGQVFEAFDTMHLVAADGTPSVT